MYIFQSTDDIGNVPNKVPKEALEISAFFPLVKSLGIPKISIIQNER
jgi:hypothetical protein